MRCVCCFRALLWFCCVRSFFFPAFFLWLLVGWLVDSAASQPHTREGTDKHKHKHTHAETKMGGGATGSLCSIKAMGVCALPPPRIFTRLHSHHTFVTKGEQVGRQRDGQTNTHTHTRTYTHMHTHAHAHTYRQSVCLIHTQTDKLPPQRSAWLSI